MATTGKGFVSVFFLFCVEDLAPDFLETALAGALLGLTFLADFLDTAYPSPVFFRLTFEDMDFFFQNLSIIAKRTYVNLMYYVGCIPKSPDKYYITGVKRLHGAACLAPVYFGLKIIN